MAVDASIVPGRFSASSGNSKPEFTLGMHSGRDAHLDQPKPVADGFHGAWPCPVVLRCATSAAVVSPGSLRMPRR